MNRLLARRAWRFLFLAVALFCWYRAMLLAGDMVEAAKTVSLRYGAGGISRVTVERMLEEEKAPFAAWRQISGQPIQEQGQLRKANIQLLEVAGDAALVLPVEELISGFLPVRGSADTCAVNAATAYALWGGVEAVGQVLVWDGREYTVTGVFARPENTVLLQSRLEADIVFPYLETAVSPEYSPRQQAEEFRARYSLEEPDILHNNVEQAAIFRQFALLPALLFALALLWCMLRQLLGKPATTLGRAGFTAVLIAGIALIAWALGCVPVIPAAAIPGRWSDFPFWSQLAENIREQGRLQQSLAMPAPDLLRWQEQRALLLYDAGALTACAATLWRKRA